MQAILAREPLDSDSLASPSLCWGRYSGPCDYDAAFKGVKTAICEAFYGPADKGVYSPSVQFTLYEMGKLAISR